MLLRAAEFFGTLVCGTGDITLSVMGKEGTANLKTKLLGISCAGTSEVPGEVIHFFLGWLLIPFTSCFYM